MHYDLIVIGSGPAGHKGAIAAAKLNKHVAIIERHGSRLGGVCLHTGTIPSKTKSLSHRVKCLLIDSRGASSVSYAMLLGLFVSVSAVLIAGVGARSKGVFARLGANDQVGIDAATGELATTNNSNTFTAGSSQTNNARRTAWVFLVVAIVSGLGAFAFGRQLGRKMRKLTQSTDLSGHEHEAMPSSLKHRILAKRQLIYGILDSNERLMSANHLEVRHVMTRDNLATVLPDATTDEITRRMRELRVRHLLVFEESKLIGVISDRDPHTRSGKTAREIMTGNPVTVSPSTPVGLAVTMLMDHGFSCLPVVEEDQVRGLLTSTDLMMTLQCLLRLMDEIAIQLNRDPRGQQVAAAAPARETDEKAA